MEIYKDKHPVAQLLSSTHSHDKGLLESIIWMEEKHQFSKLYGPIPNLA